MTREELVSALMEYQDEKGKLFEGLIPEEFKIDFNTISNEDLFELCLVFGHTGHLSRTNCLHCCLHTQGCNDCQYDIHGEKCTNDGSIYQQCIQKVKDMDSEDGVELYDKLYFLSEELAIVTDTYLRGN